MTAENPDRLIKTELESLYAEYSSELRAFLRGVLRDSDLAAEALQMTFVKVVERGESANRETFKGWLFKVALNEARGIRRRSRREAEFFRRPIWQSVDEELTPEEMLIRQESVEQLREFIQMLPSEQREVLNLRLRDEITFAEIAQQLETPLGTVLTRMRAALKKLTSQLRELDS
ncbi:MAG: sigma-70 family RNA polymerase sigma factor [Planctomycetaceae bacterium]|nr:sigma-70 family RNA polymerase sigma factor [bacterium]MDB4679689.1 sigma-70 family RNA polymerase sigma factor [Planctomycetaceae bacterium]MDG2387785.1 sigma-70 family RNA polymerase sigma factor [Planctomycetaceae bacterium]